MSFARLVPLMMIVAFGCRLPNPAFEEGGSGGSDDEFGDGSNDEVVSSVGESNGESVDDSNDSQTASSDGVDSNTSVDTNTSVDSASDGIDSSSDGIDSSSDGIDSSSDGFESSSSGSSSTDGFDTSSSSMGGEMSSSDGLDAPDLMCPAVFPDDDCFSCMQNNCCTDLDMGCFDGQDDKCFCTLQCLAEGGFNCAMICTADPLAAEHAQMLYECGQAICPNFCL